jgi:hypothetical protein
MSFGFSLSRQFSYVSSRPLSLASAYRPRRYPLLRPAPSVRSLASLSLNERLVCEPLSRRPVHKAFEPRQGMVLDVAFVQPERKFVNVAVQMLRAGVMIDADQPALQDGKDAFDAVRRHVFANIFATTVIDGVVDKADFPDTRVRAAFVGMQGRSDLNMPVNSGLDRFFIRCLDRHGDRATAALTHTKHRHLADWTAPGLEFFGLMLFFSIPPT